MAIPIKEIRLDVWNSTPRTLNLVQGESAGRMLKFIILDGLETLDLTDTTASFNIKKPDDTVVVSTATVKAEGVIEVIIPSQAVAVAGRALSELKITGTDSVTKTFSVNTLISPSVDIDGIAPSVSEFNVLDQLITDVNQVLSIADTELWPQVVENAQYFSDLAGANRTTETVKGNADEIADVAGAGRTTETVKANADNIADHIADDENPHTVTLAQLGAAADADLTALAGVGRTTETVKGNATAIAAIEAEVETARGDEDTLSDAIALKADKATLDVEQGTFTPVFEAETGVADITPYAASAFFGNYYKIGKIVNFSLRMATTSVSIGDASGALRITGLPFLPNRPTYLSPPRMDRANYVPPVNTWLTPILTETGDIMFEEQKGNTNYTTLPITVLKAGIGNYVALSGTYTIA